MPIELCYCPETLREATEILERHKTEVKICAGGTDLFVMMRKGKSQGRYLMNPRKFAASLYPTKYG